MTGSENAHQQETFTALPVGPVAPLPLPPARLTPTRPSCNPLSFAQPKCRTCVHTFHLFPPRPFLPRLINNNNTEDNNDVIIRCRRRVGIFFPSGGEGEEEVRS